VNQRNQHQQSVNSQSSGT